MRGNTMKAPSLYVSFLNLCALTSGFWEKMCLHSETYLLSLLPHLVTHPLSILPLSLMYPTGLELPILLPPPCK